MISISSKGSFKNLEAFLKRMTDRDIFSKLDQFGREGVLALADATPVESGETANSWAYEITRNPPSIRWYNTHIVNGYPIAILLQYGHGTGNGGYVQGRDYINPAIQPIFDRIANEVWKEVIA